MKKNKAMRAAGGLFVATMLTTSIISGTYAKYVTRGSANDTARVAKFGVEITADGALFSQTYKEAPANTPSTTETITVRSNDAQKVVAPGTQSDENGLTLSVSGTPEVTVKVTVKAEYKDDKDIFLAPGTYTDVTNAGEKFTVATGGYHPVKWTLKKDGTAVSGCEGVSLDTINTYFATNVNTLTYAPNTNLSQAAGFGEYKLTWKWDYGEFDGVSDNDKADTALGDLAAGTPTVQKFTTDVGENLVPGTDYSTDIDVEVSITVTQVD